MGSRLFNFYFLLCIFSAAVFNSCSQSSAEPQNSNEQCLANAQTPTTNSSNKYCWLSNTDDKNILANRILPPEGFKRLNVKAGSFGDWLRHLPLKEGNPDVHLFNGKIKNYQEGHFAVLNIDVGSTDLQQCADAVMRMRAEYLYSINDFENLHFNFTSGHTIGFKKWSEGYRTVIINNKVTWTKSAAKADDYQTFKNYLRVIFNYAGTSSLSKELRAVTNLSELEIGDVFIFGGFPGHAVLIVDVCENSETNEKLFLIQQSYMPAQEIHILNNFNNKSYSPWYSINFAGDLKTPEWTFTKTQLMRFKN